MGERPELPVLLLERAADHLTARVPVVSSTTSLSEIRQILQSKPFDTVAYVAVCEGERLVGLVSIERALHGPAESTARDVMDTDPPVVLPDTSQEVAAHQAVQHGATAVAVVDETGRFLGLVPPDRLLAVLFWEHEEDIARFGGFLTQASSARTASEEPISHRLLHRLPWLVVGLVGALLSADIVASFEGSLQEEVRLAFFLPGIVYLADAVGTQTEALVIRGLSVGVAIGRVLYRELLTGVLIGLMLAAVFLPVALWRWADGAVAIAVSLALLTASATASLTAMVLPWLFQRLGRDPAFGSGPLATVVQDLLTIAIYFAIASRVVA